MDWLSVEQPDVLLLQEVRAPEDVTAQLLGEEWEVHTHPSLIKGRAGVAVAVRRAGAFSVAAEPRMGLADDKEDVDSGRWIEVDVAGPTSVTLVSTYFHSGQVGTEKQEAKMRHLPRVGARMEELRAQGTPALVAGDFNVVRSESDIKNWKGNYNKSSGVLDEEMQFLNDWVEAGWVDVVRHLAGPVQGPYSWWSWRGKAFDNDAGWRIDYQYADSDLASRAVAFDIARAPSYDRRISDHSAVTVHYHL